MSKKFDFKNLSSGPISMIISGRPGSGKTYMIECLIKSLSVNKKISSVIVYSSTAAFSIAKNGTYDFLPKECIFSDISNLNAIIEHQKKSITKSKTIGAPILIIFDDMNNSTSFKQKEFITLVSMFRHLNISIVLSTQYINYIPSMHREQFFYAACFNLNTKNSLKACYETFGQVYDDENEFYELLRDYTREKHTFIFIDRNESDINKMYQSLKCPVIKKFSITFKKPTKSRRL